MTHIHVTKNLTYDLAADYEFDEDLIEIALTVAKLKGIPVIPYAHYPANTIGSSSTLLDISPNGYNGTITGDLTFVSAKLNNGKYFNGSTFINIGSNFDFSRTQALTIEFWIKTTDDSGYLFQRITSPGGQLKGLAINILSGKLRFNLYGNNLNRLIIEADKIINDNNFYHIIITYDGSSTATGTKIYINNTEYTYTIIADTLGVAITNGANLILGGYGGSNFVGILDEIVIYLKVLDSTERAFRYNSGTGTELLINGYSLDTPTIVNIVSLLFESPIEAFIETATKPTYTDIKYQLSFDNGLTWKYYSAGWNTITASQTDLWYYTNESNSATEINANIATLANSGNLKVRTFLSTIRGFATPELDNIEIEYIKEEEIGVYEMRTKLD